MPVSIFAMLLFGICTWFSVAIREPLMLDFAREVDIRTWVFVSVPGLFAMLFALLLYRRAATMITTVEQSMSRALLVGLSTWVAVALLISLLWCPGYRALRCASDVLLVTGIIGGAPVLAGALIAGLVLGLVMKKRVSWLAYEAPAPEPEPAPKNALDAE
jgi:hypothetical protein